MKRNKGRVVVPINEDDDENIQRSKKPKPNKFYVGELITRNKQIGKSKLQSSTSWQSYSVPFHLVSKWKDFDNNRRPMSNVRGIRGSSTTAQHRILAHCPFQRLASMHSGLSSTEWLDDDREIDENITSIEGIGRIKQSSTIALIVYFSEISKNLKQTNTIDLQLVEGLLQNGADVNATDKYGQSIMHEVARAWHTDVANFLKLYGADITRPDDFGRTPLHVSAAVDYPEMVQWLLNNGADISATTIGEQQQPLHSAARNDAVKSMKMLIQLGAQIDARDHKERTPLQVAAELDRSESARHLIENGATVGVRDSGFLPVINLLIAKMPAVAKLALDEFHLKDKTNRKQYFYLNHVEPHLPKLSHVSPKTTLQYIIEHNQMDILLHPICQKLIKVKWYKFARLRFVRLVLTHFLFVLIWTIIAITLPRDKKYYSPMKERWWHLIIDIIAVIMTCSFVIQELWDWHSSVRSHRRWVEWRSYQVKLDLPYCHPCYPDEQHYLLQELNSIKKSSVAYFKDSWNYFDWLTYSWIGAVVFTKIYAVADSSENDNAAAKLHPKLLSVGLILIWLQLMKTLRAVEALGPFIVMLGHILDDTIKFAFLYAEFFIPYVCAFWMLFGGNENAAQMKAKGQNSVDWRSFNDLVYSVWQMTVIGDFSFEALAVIDRFMAQILVGTFMATSGILLLNLFIALMSDTFQRVHDNARANAVMQRASLILSIENALPKRTKKKFQSHIQEQCNPLITFYDDDAADENGELEKMTIQIKETVDDIKSEIEIARDAFTNKQATTAKEVLQLKDNFKIHQQKVENEIANINKTLVELIKTIKNENEKILQDRDKEEGSKLKLPSFSSLLQENNKKKDDTSINKNT